MKNFIFSLGKIDKKIIWPILFAIIQAVLNSVDKLFPQEKVNQIIDTFAISLGEMMPIIIPFILKSKDKKS